ncbi:MAG: hypothetical protein RLP09_12590 [Sandaracinaceae bacterium]
MTDSNIPADFGAKQLAEGSAWFSWLGLCVGALMVAAGIAIAVTSTRDLLSMPDEPVRCAAEQCRDGGWVVVTDAEWRCRDFYGVDGSPYQYVPIAGSPVILAAVDPSETSCEEAARAPAEGVLKPARGSLAEALDAPARVLWLGHGAGNSAGLIAVGAGFVLVGLLCALWYGRRLRARRARGALEAPELRTPDSSR